MLKILIIDRNRTEPWRDNKSHVKGHGMLDKTEFDPNRRSTWAWLKFI